MYDADEVDAYLLALHEVVTDLEARLRSEGYRAHTMTRRLGRAGVSEEMLAHILLRAQQTAEEIISAARDEAAELLHLADDRAERCIAAAQVEAAELLTRARAAIESCLGGSDQRSLRPTARTDVPQTLDRTTCPHHEGGATPVPIRVKVRPHYRAGSPLVARSTDLASRDRASANSA